MKTSWIYCYSYIHVVLDSYLRDVIAINVHKDLRSMQILQMFFLSNLYRNHCCSFVHQQIVSVRHHNNERKWNVVCCAVSLWDLHVPVTDCYSPQCLNENVFIVLSKSERAHAALCLSLCWEENRTHRSVVWMCNQALNKNHDKETSVISVHLHSCLTVAYNDSDLPFTHSLFKVMHVWKETEHLLTLHPWTNESHSRSFTYSVFTQRNI